MSTTEKLSPLGIMVLHIIQNLVNNPQSIVLLEHIEGEHQKLTLTVDAQDIGKIIGKQGAMAQAIRKILHGAAIKQKKKTTLEILSHEAAAPIKTDI